MSYSNQLLFEEPISPSTEQELKEIDLAETQEKYQREIQAAQQTREQNVRQAKQEYQRETERYEARIEKDTLRSQDAARRAQQDAY